MIARTRHPRSMSCCAALLLVLQALGAGAVSIAHATERTTAPAGWEARHTASCPVLHDAARCALCHYAGVRFVAASTVVPPAPVKCASILGVADAAGRRAPVLLHAARPRAPPGFIS